jgi:NhaC family Na+:H+ antiporter
VTQKPNQAPSLGVSLIPVTFLLLTLIINIIIFKDDASSGANQIALLISAVIASGLGFFIYKQDYHLIEKKIIKSITISLQACIILFFIGSLIALWIMSGVVPTMIYYGLKIIHPSIFLPVSCLSCCVISLSTGSSWSTTGTVGIALMAIGTTLGIPEGLTAGAIISGAYFGDKMSPLSDTTNLSPAVAGSTLSTHIRHMIYTSGPAITIAIILYLIIGFFYQHDASVTQLNQVTAIMTEKFNISLFLLIPPITIFVLVYKRAPAIPSIIIGLLLGVIGILLFQQSHYNFSSLSDAYKQIMTVSFNGFSIDTGNAMIDKLLSRGGMSGMLNTIWLIFCAMVFGGAMEATKMLEVITHTILKKVRSSFSLISATLASCLFVNVTACDQYLSIVLPGRMFKQSYDDYDLAPENLSRALEDSGTVTSVLVPWNTGAVYNSAVLGVATLTYLPYAFFNLLSPIVSLVLAYTGWTILKKSKLQN